MPAAEKESKDKKKRCEYNVGDAVQYNSSTAGTWIDCNVQRVKGDEVELSCKPGRWVEAKDSKLRRRWEYGGDQYLLGEAVQFFSETYRCWLDTSIAQAKDSGEVEVECKKGHWLSCNETSQKLRRPPAAIPGKVIEQSAAGKGRVVPYGGGGVAGRVLGIGKGAGRDRPRLDRSKTCPFLLRVFHKIGGHHSLDSFAVRGKEPVDDELQVYTWPDVTLRELSDLVKDVAPEARGYSARLNFRLIYPDKAGRNVMTELGTVTSVKRGPDDEKPLNASKFQTGDLLDLAIFI